MRFDYGSIKQTLRRNPKHLLIGLGLIAIPISVGMAAPSVASQATRTVPKPCDPRTERLKAFFSRLHCPIANMAAEFIRVADENQLDWRLLPSISVIESGGGKACKNNNIFGWDNGNQAFTSVPSGIREVAYKLSRSPLYRGRDVRGKLRIYNPNAEYAQSVMTVMNRIAPAKNDSAYAFQAN
jgi:hypothetical protein